MIIARNSKENTGLLINLGGGAAAAKSKSTWPDKQSSNSGATFEHFDCKEDLELIHKRNNEGLG
jgi:hypothetical protein